MTGAEGIEVPKLADTGRGSRLPMGIRVRLSGLMLGEFFVWGAWFVTLGTFLTQQMGASGAEIALAFLTQSLGAVIAPFIVGLIADQFFPAQRILGVLHLAGGVLLWVASLITDFGPFFVVILIYMILFMPTLALANTVAFRQLHSPETQFPAIRVFGTIGWIIAGLLIGFLAWESTKSLDLTFKMASIMAILLGIYCFTLPHTPPEGRGEKRTIRDILGLDALALLKNRTFAVFFVSSIAICIPLAFYYNFTNLYLNEIGIEGAAGLQTIGQMSEVAFLLVMPFLMKRLGVKITLAIGMAAWALRYVLFGFGDEGALFWMIVVGLLLHGVCYDFFFVAGQVYTDRFAGPGLRASAQGLITLATYGVGLLIGSLISGPIVDAFATGEASHNWLQIWLIPAAIAAVVLVGFWFLFRDSKEGADSA
ncbi:nucleoside permease [Microlunatus parietis]|uniref:Nucleoside transporter n=1 Tax=Microlunatus parietis TaxID=682979 RepID=A0A7Y9I318_9ACTN|nr:nucleoside permease [Microlunatus parietis]NYE69296.1 nucleoside transporter [Microlunatus parietis]